MDGKMSLAYFEKGSENRLHRDHCGAIQLSGAQRCNGSWTDTAQLASSHQVRYLPVKLNFATCEIVCVCVSTLTNMFQMGVALYGRGRPILTSIGRYRY